MSHPVTRAIAIAVLLIGPATVVLLLLHMPAVFVIGVLVGIMYTACVLPRLYRATQPPRPVAPTSDP
jgi:hypothetical protein